MKTMKTLRELEKAPLLLNSSEVKVTSVFWSLPFLASTTEQDHFPEAAFVLGVTMTEKGSGCGPAAARPPEMAVSFFHTHLVSVTFSLFQELNCLPPLLKVTEKSVAEVGKTFTKQVTLKFCSTLNFSGLTRRCGRLMYGMGGSAADSTPTSLQ